MSISSPLKRSLSLSLSDCNRAQFLERDVQTKKQKVIQKNPNQNWRVLSSLYINTQRKSALRSTSFSTTFPASMANCLCRKKREREEDRPPVLDTNNMMSGLPLNSVRLNSLTAVGTSVPTDSGANPLNHAS